MSKLFETSNRIYKEVFGHLDNELFKADKLQEINDWLEAGDPAYLTVADLIKAWVKHDASDVAWYGSDSAATKPNKNALYRSMLTGDRIRRFGQFMSGDDAPVMARFAEFAKAQPLGAKWGYAEFTSWMIETYPKEV